MARFSELLGGIDDQADAGGAGAGSDAVVAPAPDTTRSTPPEPPDDPLAPATDTDGVYERFAREQAALHELERTGVDDEPAPADDDGPTDRSAFARLAQEQAERAATEDAAADTVQRLGLTHLAPVDDDLLPRR